MKISINWIIAAVLMISQILIYVPVASAETSGRTTININDLSSWDSVPNFVEDSVTDSGGGGYELTKFYIANDADSMFFRWDIQLKGNQTELASTNLGAALSASPAGGTTDAMVWLLFDSKGNVTYTVERLTGTITNTPIPAENVIKHNEGTKDALVSVVADVPFSLFAAVGLADKFNSESAFPLWGQTNASQQATAQIKDRIPDSGHFYYDAKTGNAILLTDGKSVMGGTISIDGTPAYNEMLTANTGEITYTPGTTADVPTYQWCRDGNPIDGAA